VATAHPWRERQRAAVAIKEDSAALQQALLAAKKALLQAREAAPMGRQRREFVRETMLLATADVAELVLADVLELLRLDASGETACFR